MAKLTEWLNKHNEQIVTETKRRPMNTSVKPDAGQQRSTLIELPFPARSTVADTLVSAYNNELRNPAQTVFVLDKSGSMAGKRMESLRSILTEPVDGSARTRTGPVGLRNREEVSIIAFDNRPATPFKARYSTTQPAENQQLRAHITALTPGGATAIYDSLQLVYQQFPATQPGGQRSIPSIVLMSDGASNTGATFDEFSRFYAGLSPEKKRIPVFVILYGEANKNEMNQLATMTGGKTFDATSGALAEAFKEIRGYQ
ncbi:vWA domain-containing protein [Corynebacterium epidermidicanis]|uniref:Mg-chelatase subunit ChlD n=1 Tax=Corynebacterium epidermidicanis TaxID=1050174 RepID=A0A0G3GR33_9CORY|nr:vWA domain-containing protein [Corynebacterium epidermidicanis]AKK03040.1 Mg-chelatase subunit ChlD [Corynebacterium epidermidicanis]